MSELGFEFDDMASYFTWSAEMVELRERGPAAIQAEIFSDLHLREHALLKNVTTLPNGMIAGFSPWNFLEMDAAIVWKDRKYIVVESCGTFLGTADVPDEHDHTLVVASGPVFGDYDRVGQTYWHLPFLEGQRHIPEPFLNQLKELADSFYDVEQADALTLLENELEMAIFNATLFKDMDINHLMGVAEELS